MRRKSLLKIIKFKQPEKSKKEIKIIRRGITHSHTSCQVMIQLTDFKLVMRFDSDIKNHFFKALTATAEDVKELTHSELNINRFW